MSLSTRAVIVALLFVSQGCYIDFKRPGGPQVVVGSPGRQNRRVGENGLAGGFGAKIVEDKRPPTRLLARDRTSCTVPENKYNSTVLGESIWCTWYHTDR